MQKLTREQSLREHQFYDLCQRVVPQLAEPKWLVAWLAKSLPTTCTFRRAVFWRGRLVYFVPALCHCSPWFEATVRQQMQNMGWGNCVAEVNNKE